MSILLNDKLCVNPFYTDRSEGYLIFSSPLSQAGLQPRDSVEVLYKVGGEGGGASLTRVIEGHREYIETTTKGPVNPWTLDSDLSNKIVEEEQKVKYF